MVRRRLAPSRPFLGFTHCTHCIAQGGHEFALLSDDEKEDVKFIPRVVRAVIDSPVFWSPSGPFQRLVGHVRAAGLASEPTIRVARPQQISQMFGAVSPLVQSNSYWDHSSRQIVLLEPQVRGLRPRCIGS